MNDNLQKLFSHKNFHIFYQQIREFKYCQMKIEVKSGMDTHVKQN